MCPDDIIYANYFTECLHGYISVSVLITTLYFVSFFKSKIFSKSREV